MVSNRSNGIYRSIVASIIGLAIVATALFFLIRDLSTVDSAYSHSAADAAVEYERDAQAYIKETCLTPAGLRNPDCSAKAHEAAREGQRKEQDLAAQNITAWWTKVMGIAAIIGMALSAVGVWLVKATFDATHRSNEIATEIGQAQTRCYINGAYANINYVSDNEWIVNCLVKNSGQSPAVKLRWYPELTLWCPEISSGVIFTPEKDFSFLSYDIPANGEEMVTPATLRPTVDASKLSELRQYNSFYVTLRLKLTCLDVFGLPVEVNERFEVRVTAIPNEAKSFLGVRSCKVEAG